MQGMTNTNPLRKKNTGEPGNGGEFGRGSRDEAPDGLLDNAVAAAATLSPSALLDAVRETEALDAPALSPRELREAAEEAAAVAEDIAAANDPDLMREVRQINDRFFGRTWATTGVYAGSRTPWGTAQHAMDYAEGITVVDTESHGGFKLSPTRNLAVHPALRQRSGWYEEDAESHIIRFTFPDETRPRGHKNGHTVERSAEYTYANAKDGIRRWYPDAFEKITGEPVLPGQSGVRDEQLWNEANADNFVGLTSGPDPDDESSVVVIATRNGEEQRFRVPADEYKAGSQWTNASHGRFVIDPARHEQLPAFEPEPKVPTKKYTGINLQGLTESAARRVTKDLTTQWRSRTGEVRTLRAIIGRGISDKTVYVENGRRKYALSVQEFEGDSNSSTFTVSKETWLRVDAPDDRSPRQQLNTDLQVLDAQIDKAYGQERRELEAKRRAVYAEREKATE
jgi:hypothetical protein